MKLVFMGTPQFSVPSLQALYRAGHEIALVVTNPDRPKGRGKKLTAPPVKIAAEELGLPIMQIQAVKNSGLKERLHEIQPDIGCVVAFGHYLPKSIRKAPTHGLINVHASLLPKHRGAAPIAQAIWDGDEKIGVSIMEIARKMDAGRVWLQQGLTPAIDETCGTMTEKLSNIGAELLVQSLEKLALGQITPQDQDHTQATLVNKLSKADGKIDWSQSANQIDRQIRALNPWPMTRFQLEGKAVTVVEACLPPETCDLSSPNPGSVLKVKGPEIYVACGENTALVLKQVKPAGKKAMAAGDFARGRQIKPGVLFTNGN